MNLHTAEHLFQGPLAEEYHLLNLICPAAVGMSQAVARQVAEWAPSAAGPEPALLELGSGTGITTTFLLAARTDLHVTGVDNAPAMLAQARQSLASALADGRLQLREQDALAYLEAQPSASVDIVASAYTLHNLLSGYRSRVLAEVHRVLKPGGLFVNGDRYALDDPAEHLRNTQEEVRHYFRVLLEHGRPDILEQWIVHLFSDESVEHIMRLQFALDEMSQLGFREIAVHGRQGVNALVTAVKAGS